MTDFTPTVYLKQNCPFCLKVRIALLETGLKDEVAVREFAPGSDEENAIREELAPHFEKVTFPSAQLEEGKYINDSDPIVDALLDRANAEKADLPTLSSYLNGAFPNMMKLYRENAELKAQSA